MIVALTWLVNAIAIGIRRMAERERSTITICGAHSAYGQSFPFRVRLRVLFFVALAACGDNYHAPAHLLDAPEFFDAPPYEDSGLGCCAFYPDAAAIGACAAPKLPPCTCAVTACRRPESDGGGFLKINSCGPTPDGGSCFPQPDAGVDAP